jgi:hypothetical protein
MGSLPDLRPSKTTVVPLTSICVLWYHRRQAPQSTGSVIELHPDAKYHDPAEVEFGVQI